MQFLNSVLTIKINSTQRICSTGELDQYPQLIMRGSERPTGFYSGSLIMQRNPILMLLLMGKPTSLDQTVTSKLLYAPPRMVR